MEFNGKDDALARWLHGICALPLAVVAFLFIRCGGWHQTSRGWIIGASLGFSIGYVSYRCAFYAITGRRSINEDDMWRINCP